MSNLQKTFIRDIVRKFFGCLDECNICYDTVQEYAFLSNCSHYFCKTCITEFSKTNKLCPCCQTRYNSIIDQETYFRSMCDLVMKDPEDFKQSIEDNKYRYNSTLIELMEYLNAIKDNNIRALEQLSRHVEFHCSSEFRQCYQKINATFKLGRDPSEIQSTLLNELMIMDATTSSKTMDYILHMDDSQCEEIVNFCNIQREVKMGHLLKVLAFCDNYKGHTDLLTIMYRYDSTKIARIVKCLFMLPKNGYRETLALLTYHEKQSDEFTNAFFEHYYHNQWINHDHFDDETVMEINRQDDGKVVSVFGNAYDRKGRLLYTGFYKDREYHGHGKLYTENQNFYEGTFANGKREGEFLLKSERYICERASFSNDLRNGICYEYFNDGKTVRSECNYLHGKKNGNALEKSGTGSLLFKGQYKDNVRVGECYVYEGPTICKKGRYVNGVFEQTALCYHPVTKTGFCWDETFYDDVYYNTEPRLLVMDNKLSFCFDKEAEIYIDKNILSVIQNTRREKENCLKPEKNSSCSSLVITGNGVDVIDFQDIWNILLDLTMLTYNVVILLDMKLKNVHVYPGITPVTFSELVFDHCTFTEALFEERMANTFTAIRFIECLDLKRIYVKNAVFSQVKSFDVKFCPDLEVLEIEDNNCPDVPSFSLEKGARNLKMIKLGKRVFSLCCEFLIKDAQKLETLSFGEESCKSGTRFRILGAPILKEITFEKFSFMNGCYLQILSTPQLQSISMGGGNFKAINTIIIHDAPALTKFTKTIPNRKSPKIEYENSHPDGLTGIKTWLNMKN